jgi:hypothetical protein
VAEEASEKDIRDFYKNVDIVKVHPAMPGAFDLEFRSKEDLVRAIDIGETFLLKQPFYIRSSYFKSREGRGRDRDGGRGSRFRGDRDRDRRGDRDRDRDREPRDRFAPLTRYEGHRYGADPDDRDRFQPTRDRPRGDGFRDKEAPPPRRWEDRDGAKDDQGLSKPGSGAQAPAGQAGLDRSGVVRSRGALE